MIVPLLVPMLVPMPVPLLRVAVWELDTLVEVENADTEVELGCHELIDEIDEDRGVDRLAEGVVNVTTMLLDVADTHQ